MKSKPFHGQSSGNGGSGSPSDTSPSPPPSPPSPRRPVLRRRGSAKAKQSLAGGGICRRKLRYLLVLPLVYLSGLIMCVGPFSALVGPTSPPPPGSLYRSHETFRRLWEDISSDNYSSTAIEIASVWSYRKQKEQKPCPNSTATQLFETMGPNGYLIIEANGGLNQQRSAICNAVAVAGLLNAILVIPQFEFNSVWRDSSKFSDIYDEDHFISTLEGYVKVAKELPQELMERYDYNTSNIPNFRVQAWASVNYYTGVVYPVLRSQGVIRISPFANRLAMNVPPHIQFLRCLANYEALRFSAPILTLGRTLVSRMAERSSRTGGKYVSVHLRFEEDMVAFSCCLYDGGEAEKSEMDLIREKGWKQKFKRQDRVISPGQNRAEGKCPLTPVEVGMMLRGMGFDNNTSIYLASGKIYEEERHLAPLLKMFPQLHTKESLASADELAPFQGFSSRMAALDYTVCLLSEVFVTTQGGNFPHFLMGHRRFFYGGHARTVIPDKRKLAVLLEDRNISWKGFKDEMEAMLAESDRKGLIVPRVKKINRKSSVYTYPFPECRCLQQRHNAQPELNTHS